jgi:hypothetical protein
MDKILQSGDGDITISACAISKLEAKRSRGLTFERDD